MSKTDENRIVLINSSGSEWYEQAIFILKSPNAAKPKNLVFEAERIINDYMRTGSANCRNERMEQYKKKLAERSAQPAQATSSTAKPAAEAAAETTAKRTKKRKTDYTSFLINICLVMASILLGYLMCRIMLQ